MQIKICDSVFYKMQNQNNKYGEMAERSKAAVLKTVEVKASWGSNPYLSARVRFNVPNAFWCVFYLSSINK